MSTLKIVVANADRDFFNMLAETVRFGKDMEIMGGSGECREVLQLIQKKKPNVLVMDLLLENSNALLACSRLRFLELPRVQNHVIVPISSDWDGLSDHEISLRLTELFACIQKILKLSSPKKQDLALEARVSQFLRQLGVPAHIKGYQYLREAIITAIKDPEVMTAVTKILYPDIAKMYGTTANGVERAIRKAIDTAWNRGSSDCLRRCFGYADGLPEDRPTNSEFIATIVDILCLQQDHSVLLTRARPLSGAASGVSQSLYG